VSELINCGCWYTDNGYGENRHPSGFHCTWCGDTGRTTNERLMSPRAGTHEVARLTLAWPDLQGTLVNCPISTHLPFLISAMGTERALLYLVTKLATARQELLTRAVELSMAACPNIDAHLKPQPVAEAE